jgi:hypothetical protein
MALRIEWVGARGDGPHDPAGGGMIYFIAAIAVIAAAALWPARRHRRGVTMGAAMVAIGAVATAWLVATIAASLPAGPETLPGLPDGRLAHRVIAASDDWAFVDSGDALARVSLPDGSFEGMHPFNHLVRSVAFGDGVLAIVDVETEPRRDGLALLAPDGWRVAPGEMHLAPQSSVSWDAQREAFAVFEPVSIDEPSVVVDARQIGSDGAERPGETLTVRSIAPGGFDQMCIVGRALYAIGPRGEACRISEPTGGGPRKCVPVEAQARSAPGSWNLASCPGSAIRAAWAAGWLSPSGFVPHVRPEGFPEHPIEAHVHVAPDESVEPRLSWITERRGNGYRLSHGVVFLESLDDHEAALAGLPNAALRVRLRRHGGGEQRAFVNDWGAARFLVLESRDEIVVLSGDLGERARFDGDTLDRLDRLDAVRNVRERLSPWGGPSVLFETAFALTLAGAALLPMLLAGAAVRCRRRPKTAVTPQRIALAFAALALPTAVAALRRLLHL